jgi:hypothetical protein
MGIQEFPEIETFQKLPRRVIVKGGSSGFNDQGKPQLRGIVINNIGPPIRDVRVSVVIFNADDIPAMSLSVSPEPSSLQQGGITSFTFVAENFDKEIANYYLYADWKYDD